MNEPKLVSRSNKLDTRKMVEAYTYAYTCLLGLLQSASFTGLGAFLSFKEHLRIDGECPLVISFMLTLATVVAHISMKIYRSRLPALLVHFSTKS